MRRLAVLTLLVCTVGAEIDAKPDCSKVGNGIYGNGCSSEFYMCLENEVIFRQCPLISRLQRLYFNPLTIACDFKENVPICNDAKDEDTKPDCSKLGDGLHAKGCSSSFYFCSENRLSVSKCSDNLYFDPISKLCDFQWKVPMCEVAEPDCSKLGDGVHANGCSSEFYTCRDNKLTVRECSGNLYFNPLNNACEPKDQVPICAQAKDSKLDCNKLDDGWYTKECSQDFHGCWGHKLDVGHCSGNLYFNSLTNACEPKDQVPVCAEAKDDKPDCNKVAEGWHTNGCSKDFYGCHGNEMEIGHCSGDLYFNPLTHACESKEKVPLCNGGNDVKLDCSKEANGWHAKGCSSEFHGCWDNKLVIRQCAKDHYFNPLSHTCEPKEKVLICNETKGAKPDCSRGDGVHERGCSNRFYMCKENRLFNMICPSGMYYDPLTNHCEVKEKPSICNDVHTFVPIDDMDL